MATLLSNKSEAVTPTPDDSQLALESSQKLAHFIAATKQDKLFHVSVTSGNEKVETIAMPASALRVLNDILKQMAIGNAVTFIPVHTELTTQQAADILNVSRPFLIEQLEKKLLPFRKVGTHRRILFQDVMNYQEQMKSDRLNALDQLAAQAQELDMGY